MRATRWEFTNRATIFGLIYGLAFPLYIVDHQNAAAALAGWMAPGLHADADRLTRLLFSLGALLAALGALFRTWGSAYLDAGVVYAARVRTESLVAGGPYRRVRNPLYFGNVLMVLGLGFMMSRFGYAVAVAGNVIFCYRLILREEAELQASQGEAYERYQLAVPRLGPSWAPRIPAAGRSARWKEGFRAEIWSWGFAASVAGFAITLSLPVFFAILGASVAVLFASGRVLGKDKIQ